jgi:hypothetical protein
MGGGGMRAYDVQNLADEFGIKRSLRRASRCSFAANNELLLTHAAPFSLSR